jgi:thiol-disulfide isomerase/thioredoxin
MQQEITVTQTHHKPKGSDPKTESSAEARRRARNRLLVWIGAGVLGIALLTGFLLFSPTPEGAATVEGEASTGAVAPSVEMVGFNGETIALADYSGTAVVLNFWASWCPFCIA